MSFLCAEYDYEMDMRVKGKERYEDGFEAGRETGHETGQEKLSRLVSALLDENKVEEVKKVTKDREYRNQLYKIYNIE